MLRFRRRSSSFRSRLLLPGSLLFCGCLSGRHGVEDMSWWRRLELKVAILVSDDPRNEERVGLHWGGGCILLRGFRGPMSECDVELSRRG